jgi:predicted dienelactone hydrolase
VDGGLFGETVGLTIYEPDSAGPTPVVVLSHGFQLGPADYTSYAEHLASWGFTVVLPSFPGSLISPRTHAELKTDLQSVLDWSDVTLNASAIGLAGHSMGGKISLLVASDDPRPAAVFGIDPVDAAPPFSFNAADYPSVTPELMPDITVPLVLLGETVNSGGGGGFGQACAPADDNFHQYFTNATSPALEIEVTGANHMSFLDNPNCGLPCLACTAGTDDPAQTLSLTRGYMTAFFLVELADDASFQTFLTGAEMQADVNAGLVTTATANGYP